MKQSNIGVLIMASGRYMLRIFGDVKRSLKNVPVKYEKMQNDSGDDETPRRKGESDLDLHPLCDDQTNQQWYSLRSLRVERFTVRVTSALTLLQGISALPVLVLYHFSLAMNINLSPCSLPAARTFGSEQKFCHSLIPSFARESLAPPDTLRVFPMFYEICQ